MINLTADKINKISAGAIAGAKAADLANSLNLICPKYGISTPDIFHEFIANVLHESNCFMVLAENLNYSADSLIKLFGRHRITVEQANQFGRKVNQSSQPSAIANILYGGQFGKINLGNTQPGDGWLFRGSGPIQITGRANVTKFTAYYNKLTGSNITPEAMAALLRSNIEIGIHSACWIFSISKKLIDEAEADNMKEIVKRINGGYIGMDERLKYLNLAKTFII